MTPLTLIALFAANQSKAGYLDVGYTNQLSIKTMHKTKYGALYAEKSNQDYIGIALPYKIDNVELYAGIKHSDETQGFIHGVYRLNRYVYDLGYHGNELNSNLNLGFSYLLTEDWGLTLQYDFLTKQSFVGFRKWTR